MEKGAGGSYDLWLREGAGKGGNWENKHSNRTDLPPSDLPLVLPTG